MARAGVLGTAGYERIKPAFTFHYQPPVSLCQHRGLGVSLVSSGDPESPDLFSIPLLSHPEGVEPLSRVGSKRPSVGLSSPCSWISIKLHFLSAQSNWLVSFHSISGDSSPLSL